MKEEMAIEVWRQGQKVTIHGQTEGVVIACMIEGKAVSYKIHYWQGAQLCEFWIPASCLSAERSEKQRIGFANT